MVNSHACSGVCGVGPAESTGKSWVTYWPGGTRAGSTAGRRPRKPREIGAIGSLRSVQMTLPVGGDAARRSRHRLVGRMVIGPDELRAVVVLLSHVIPEPGFARLE